VLCVFILDFISSLSKMSILQKLVSGILGCSTQYITWRVKGVAEIFRNLSFEQVRKHELQSGEVVLADNGAVV
jgi:hypothetical protein